MEKSLSKTVTSTEWQNRGQHSSPKRNSNLKTIHLPKFLCGNFRIQVKGCDTWWRSSPRKGALRRQVQAPIGRHTNHSLACRLGFSPILLWTGLQPFSSSILQSLLSALGTDRNIICLRHWQQPQLKTRPWTQRDSHMSGDPVGAIPAPVPRSSPASCRHDYKPRLGNIPIQPCGLAMTWRQHDSPTKAAEATPNHASRGRPTTMGPAQACPPESLISAHQR